MVVAITILAGGLVTGVMASDKAPAKAATGSAVPATVHGQPSVFTLNASTKDPIKDPFYPKSTRLIPIVTTNVVATISKTEFVLKGLSGIEGQRLALVNDRNFAEGETDDVSTPSGKRRIQVIRIKDFSVIVRADGNPETFELSLPKELR